MYLIRLLAVINMPIGAPKVISLGDIMLACMMNNALFANYTPGPAAFETDLDDLRKKQAARNGGSAAIEARNTALRLVKRNMESFRTFVQQLADNTPDKAAEIITAAGMTVRKIPIRYKPDLEIKQGVISGSVTAIAKSRGRGTTYWWEISTDQKNWSGSTPTRTAQYSYANLTAGTVYYFRFQTLTKDGMSDWSQVLSFMVK